MPLPAGTGLVLHVGVDIVEVLRGTTAGPRLIAAGAVGGVAAAAVLVSVALWWAAGRRRAGAVRAVRATGAVALLATVTEGALLLTDGATLGDRWATLVLARALMLLVFLERNTTGLLRDLLAVPLLLTALFGAPLASGAAAPATALAVTAVALAGTMLLVGVHRSSSQGSEAAVPTSAHTATHGPARTRRRSAAHSSADTATPAPARTRPPDGEGIDSAALPVNNAAVGRRTMLAGLVVLAATAAVLGPLSAPDPVPPHHQERQIADGLTFDLTIAPARPGPNEAHLYAFDATGQPTAVTEVSIAVVGDPTSDHELFEVSPDHHLSYALELPDAPPWQVVFRASGEDGKERELRLDIDG